MASSSEQSGHIPRGRFQPGSRIPGRNVSEIHVTEESEKTPAQLMGEAFSLMQRHLLDIANAQVDETKVFDQYLAQGLTGYSTNSITLLPSYEYTERVESIIITGPAGACTLQLGDRVWTITIPAAGIYVIAPVAILLGRSDIRQLTAGTPGDYTLELMGHADIRWST
jgi:hypothetical protein